MVDQASTSERRPPSMIAVAIEAIVDVACIFWSIFASRMRQRFQPRLRGTTEGERFARGVIIASILSVGLWSVILALGYYLFFR